MTSYTGPSPGDAPENRRDKVKRALTSRIRLDAIRRSGLLESANTIPALNRAARIAARALRANVAQVSVLTDRVKLPIAVYTDPDEDAELWRMRRRAGNTYCKYVVWTREPFVVEDSATHELVRTTHATRDLRIGAYLAVPIHGPAGNEPQAPVLGSLCVVTRDARAWSESDIETLSDIAASVSEEIAYRVRARDEVRAAERQTIRFLDSVTTGMLATDAKGVITYANRAALRMLGYSSEDLIGKDQHAIIHHSRPDGSRYNESDCPNYLARVEGHAHTAVDDTYWKSDGGALRVDSSMTPIFDRGELVETVLTFEDVSARRDKLAAAAARHLSVVESSRAKTELFAVMSHELNDPASAIGDHASRLEAALLPVANAEQRAELQGILSHQQRLVGLIAKMSGFAMLPTGPEPGE